MTIDAIVLAGGRARRLGGASKPQLLIGDQPLLSRVLGAIAEVNPRCVVVVGPPELTPEGALGTQETPPFGGPVAGLAAALERLGQVHPAADSLVLLLACDLPRASRAVAVLLQREIDATLDGVHLIDAAGRAQWLVGVYRRSSLEAALGALEEPRGASMGALMHRLTLATVTDPEGVSMDVDTWQDVEEARRAVQAGEWM